MLPPEVQDILIGFDLINYTVTHHSDKKIEIHLVGYPLSETQGYVGKETEVSEIMRNALIRAARDLYDAGLELGRQRTLPETPRPRRKEIELCPGHKWPGEVRDEYQYIWAIDETGLKMPVDSPSFIDLVIATNHGMPVGVLRSVRRMQQAARWCRRRMTGREKAARDIMACPAQQRAYYALEADGMMNVFTEGFK